ncbi:ROK family protein [Granulicoccus sp. GXG6511]|uniref:ROK family protein n=1 Tax=Granulicoccus sp. GXG6511 TaxID=3381351 RepID=UPI003D7EDA72
MQIGVPHPPAGRVLALVRRLGTAKREELARRTGLSAATVARAASALVDAGLLRYAIERPAIRGVGRPGTPLAVDARRFAVLGLHLGRRMATVALGDLTGRVLDARVQPHRQLDPGALGELAGDLLAAAPHRQPLAAGIVAPWRELDWNSGDVAQEMHGVLGLDIETTEHIPAMARAEFLAPQAAGPGRTAFLYARETAGFVVVDQSDDRAVHSPETALNHFPTGSDAACECGRTGCLMATAGDTAIAQRAYAEGWVDKPRIDLVFRGAAAGRVELRSLLTGRAEMLARTAGHVLDMCSADRLVLAGQAFTADPSVLARARACLDAEVAGTRFGSSIQASAACAVALQPVDANPIALAPRA